MNSNQISMKSSSQKCLSLYQKSQLQNNIYQSDNQKKPRTSKSTKKQRRLLLEKEEAKEKSFVNRGFSGYEQPTYNALIDPNLKDFFNTKSNKQLLRKMKLVSREGYILQDQQKNHNYDKISKKLSHGPFLDPFKYVYLKKQQLKLPPINNEQSQEILQEQESQIDLQNISKKKLNSKLDELRMMQQKSKLIDQQNQVPTQSRKKTFDVTQNDNVLNFKSDYYVWVNFHYLQINQEIKSDLYIQMDIKNENTLINSVQLPINSMVESMQIFDNQQYLKIKQKYKCQNLKLDLQLVESCMEENKVLDNVIIKLEDGFADIIKFNFYEAELKLQTNIYSNVIIQEASQTQNEEINDQQIQKLPDTINQELLDQFQKDYKLDDYFVGDLYLNVIKLFNIKNKEMNNKQVKLEIQLLENGVKTKSIQSKQYHLKQEQYDVPIFELHNLKLQILKSNIKAYKLEAQLQILEDENTVIFEIELEEIMQNTQLWNNDTIQSKDETVHLYLQSQFSSIEQPVNKTKPTMLI